MSRKGFTLIEILLVIIILGIIASMITGNFLTSLKKGRDAKRKADFESIQKGLEMYYEDNRAYPSSVTSGGAMTDQSTGKVYMQSIPYDPSGTNYEYETDANGTYYRLYGCLENSLQTLPYTIGVASFPIECKVKCKDKSDATVNCTWVVSSSNVAPIP